MKIFCKRGHEQTEDNIYVRPNGKRQCKKCVELYRKSPTSINAIKKWQKENPDKVKAILAKHRSTESYRLKHNKQMKVYYKTYLPQLQKDVLTHYGNGRMACVCCGMEGMLFLTVDHVNGRLPHEKKNGKHRGWILKQYLRSHGYPEGYQTLCWNCNCARALNKGICPHKAKSDIAI